MRWVAALLSLALCAPTWATPAGAVPDPSPVAAVPPPPGGSPLGYPLVQSTSGTFTFLGSFKIANNSLYAGQPGAMSVSGSTLYVGGNGLDPNDTSHSVAGGGVGSVTIPALSGTPAYDGSNGTTSIVIAPQTPATYVAPATACPSGCTLTSAPSSGAVSAQFSGSAPTGFAANAGWYVKFNVGNQDKLITSWNAGTNTFGWSGGLSSGSYTTTVTVHQWLPTYPWGNASGMRITGTLPYAGNVLETGGAYYDASGTVNNGWILQANSSLTGWGSTYSASTVASAAQARRYAGSLGNVPTAWQTLLGGAAYVAQGFGLSNISQNVTIGYGFSTFDPSTVGAGPGTITLTPLLDYFFEGALGAAYKKELAARSFSGPFPCGATSQPCTNTTFYPATITTGNGTGPNGLTGATQVTLAVPTGVVTATANITNTGCTSNAYCNLLITSVNSGTISNSGISYTAVGTSIPANDLIDPARDQGPGNPTGAGTGPCPNAAGCYLLHTAGSSQTGISVTLTPAGYSCTSGAGYITMTFSDGETRTGHINCATGNVTFPSAQGGVDNIDPTSFAALTCVSCTTAVSIGMNGDNWAATYEGALGTGFIVPGSRSLIFVSLQEYGPAGVRNDYCNAGASGSNELPWTPDTLVYISPQITAFDLQDVINAKNGLRSDTSCPADVQANDGSGIGIYATCPYGQWEIPSVSANLKVSGTGCLLSRNVGWATFDATSNILYAMFGYSNQSVGGAAAPIVYEWHVNSP